VGAGLTVERVDALYCRIPLEQPIVLGELVISHRDFVLTRVRTSDGVDGLAYALSRGAPVDIVVTDLLAPLLVGRDAQDIARRVEEMTRAMVTLGPDGIVQRAISLLELCLWDIKGRVASMPVWRLLGGYRDQADVLLVAPYAAPDEVDEAYAERLTEHAARGYAALKLYPLPNPAAMAKRLAVLRDVLGARIGLIVDMAWSWRSSRQAIEAVRGWEGSDLAWVEDPLPASDWRSLRALSDAVETPIAAGDEVTLRGTMETLIEERAVDVHRLDAMTIGGLSAFAAVRGSASRAGLTVSPHAYPEIHRHCVFAWPDVGPIEVFPSRSPTWGTSRFLEDEPDLPGAAGTLAAPMEPGLGLHIDWAAAGSLALRTTAATR
jgi:L-alanine-DL-glutamate epimerase-like enolase superfamily enzyme